MSGVHVAAAAVWREVKVLRVIVEVVLLEELLQLLNRAEPDAARAVQGVQKIVTKVITPLIFD